MWGAAVSNPPHHYHYPPGPNGPNGVAGPAGPILAGPPNARHLRPQSSYSLPHGSNGPGRWGWTGNHVSSFDRRQLKGPAPPQPNRPAPVRPSNKNAATNNVSKMLLQRYAKVYALCEFIYLDPCLILIFPKLTQCFSL